jgi:hypothetical protein
MAKPKLSPNQTLTRAEARRESLHTISGLGRKWVFALAVARILRGYTVDASPEYVFDALYDVNSLTATVAYSTAFNKTREYAEKAYNAWNVRRIAEEANHAATPGN